MLRDFPRLVRGLVVALAAFAAAPAVAQGNGPLVVYNAQHDTLTQAWVDAFTKETGIKVVMRQGSDMQFANQIGQEGAGSPAEVFRTENSPAMAVVERAGLFKPLSPELLALAPEQFRPSSGKWVGIAARSTVFAYDKRKLNADTLPKSIMDLAKPEWKGRWAASPSGADFQAIVSAMLALKGEAATRDWLVAMKQNSVAYRGNSTAMKAVNAGEIQGAVIYHYYWFGDQAKTGENSGNVALHYFRGQDPGAFVSISGGGILASTKRPTEAEAFLRFVAGKGGQEILRTGNAFEYAVGVGQASHPKLVPLDDVQSPKVDPSKLDSLKVIELMTAAGLL